MLRGQLLVRKPSEIDYNESGMRKMEVDSTELITNTLCRAASAYGEKAIPFEHALELVTEFLPRLLELLKVGLVTEREVANAITDRFVVWLDHRSGRRFIGAAPSWDLVVDDVERMLRDSRNP